MVGIRREQALVELVATPTSSVVCGAYFFFDGSRELIGLTSIILPASGSGLESRKNTPDCVLRCFRRSRETSLVTCDLASCNTILARRAQSHTTAKCFDKSKPEPIRTFLKMGGFICKSFISGATAKI